MVLFLDDAAKQITSIKPLYNNLLYIKCDSQESIKLHSKLIPSFYSESALAFFSYEH